MVSTSVLLVVRILAGLGAMAMICSPSILMKRIYKHKHVGVTSVLPLVMLLANSHMWMMYGYMSEYWFPIFTSYLFGDIAALSYIAVYWSYTTERRYVGRVFGVVLASLAILTIYAIVGGLGYIGQTRSGVSSTLGYVGDVTAICLYVAPMEKLLQVLKYKSAAFINPHMVVAGLANNCMWVTYGILTTNWIIVVPNSLFVVINSSTLVVYMAFNPKTHPLPASYLLADDTGDSNSPQIRVSVELQSKVGADRKDGNVPSCAYEGMQSPSMPLRS